MQSHSVVHCVQGHYLFHVIAASFRLLFLRFLCAVAFVVIFRVRFVCGAVTFLVRFFHVFLRFVCGPSPFLCVFFTFILRLFVSCDCAITFFSRL